MQTAIFRFVQALLGALLVEGGAYRIDVHIGLEGTVARILVEGSGLESERETIYAALDEDRCESARSFRCDLDDADPAEPGDGDRSRYPDTGRGNAVVTPRTTSRTWISEVARSARSPVRSGRSMWTLRTSYSGNQPTVYMLRPDGQRDTVKGS